jgi:hypothetical protein
VREACTQAGGMQPTRLRLRLGERLTHTLGASLSIKVSKIWRTV